LTSYNSPTMPKLIVPKIPALLYGGDYNPEQWPESVWQEDVRLMREAGVNMVSVAIFAWAKLNPAPGQFTFDWLDRLMDLLAEKGIFADLATATAAPPAWLAKKFPKMLAVDQAGQTLWWGSRQGYTPSSPTYRAYAAELVTALATHYKDHPALAIWHINNEYGCHVPLSYGEADALAFRAWLKQKYASLDALNEAWGTAFWSQTYTDWEQIIPPRQSPAQNNPGQKLDFRRFFSQMWLECCQAEARILREITPGIPITTNFMGFHFGVNPHPWAETLDFASWDSYPDPQAELFGAPLGHDLTRSIKQDTPFVLMEQVTGQVNWRPVNKLKPPGVMRLWSLQAVARGADGIAFFQWRKARAGAEKFHSAMVEHVPAEKSRLFAEVKQLGADLKKLAPVVGSPVAAQAGILFDWNSWWGSQGGDQPLRLDPPALTSAFHQAFFEGNIAVDILPPSRDLARYKLLIAPALYLLTESDAQRLTQWVRAGGTLLTTFFSGIVDEADRIHLGGYPAPLREVLGLWVEEWQPYSSGTGNQMKIKDGGSVATTLFAEVLHTEGAKALATFEEDFFAGSPALTRHAFGRGAAYYLATWPEAAFLKKLVAHLCDEAGLVAPLSVPTGVEVSQRGAFLFLLNHNTEAVELKRLPKGTDLLTGKAIAGKHTLAGRDVLVLKCQ